MNLEAIDAYDNLKIIGKSIADITGGKLIGIDTKIMPPNLKEYKRVVFHIKDKNGVKNWFEVDSRHGNHMSVRNMKTAMVSHVIKFLDLLTSAVIENGNYGTDFMEGSE